MSQRDIKIAEKHKANSMLMPEIIRMLENGHTVILRLKGFSMRPFLEDGRDKALLKRPSNLKKGDPVLAEISKGHFVLHRIISIDNGNVTLQGDGNINTEVCRLNDIKGVAIGFYRKGSSRLDSISGLKWRIYSSIWTSLYPFRRYLLAVYRHIWIKIFPIKKYN